MKKQILNLGKKLSKAEQKTVFGGMGFGDPCPCSPSFREEGPHSCSYPSVIQGLFPGSRCLGEITQGGELCCES